MENSAPETTRIPPVFIASEAKKEGYEEELGHPLLEEDLDGGCPHHHHKHHHGRRGYKNPFKFAFFLLLGVNVVGVMKHCQMMRRKMEWCKAHPKKCEKWKKHHGMHDGGKMEAQSKRGGEFLRNPIVDYFWPQPPMWMRHHAHDDEDWETTVKFEGETFPPEELGSENIGLETFRVPENWKCKKHRKRARGRNDDDHDHDDDDDDHKYRGGKN
tara:strand:+ start:408 stop:1049 length:642 start_codon:yes stop_codon:yes gene_type:complete